MMEIKNSSPLRNYDQIRLRLIRASQIGKDTVYLNGSGPPSALIECKQSQCLDQELAFSDSATRN